MTSPARALRRAEDAVSLIAGTGGSVREMNGAAHNKECLTEKTQNASCRAESDGRANNDAVWMAAGNERRLRVRPANRGGPNRHGNAASITDRVSHGARKGAKQNEIHRPDKRVGSKSNSTAPFLRGRPMVIQRVTG
jgi:hypothetical protein